MPKSDSFGQESRIFLDWEIAYHETENIKPTNWMPAVVPGAVQLDVMRAENYKQPYWYADNFKQFDWMEDWYFTYRTTFEKPEFLAQQKIYFSTKGIDYQYKILLNGETIHEQEGMFAYADIDITDRLLQHNELRILIYPIPKVAGATNFIAGTDSYRGHARESAKPAVSYGWDWHPRLVTRGIWDETFLKITNKSHLEEVDFTYQLDKNFSNAKVDFTLKGKSIVGSFYRWKLTAPNGEVILEKSGKIYSNEERIEAQVLNPVLWWPNGYGDPSLYTSDVQLLDENQKLLDRKTSKVGFKTVRLIMNEGEWERPIGFPATRNRAPASLEINGKRIFAKGTNWVHPEIFVGLITKETYKTQIQLAKDANFNILRVWGGGIVNKESFFDLCDEMGLLVWQEFPLACNTYTDDKKYLNVLEKEATEVIKRVKQHVSLAIWSGGNELFNAWGGMTDQSLALRLLNSLCYQLDPKTPYIATSPLNGMGHGSYIFYDESNSKGSEVFQWMAKSDNTAYTEFGVAGISNLEVLKQFIPADEIFPPRRGTAWETHHAFGVWRENSWLELPFLEKYFGKMKRLEDLVKYSQLIQSEGLKFIYEEARRQKPYCSMALNWCFQEPWPTAANNSIINWPNIPKPAYQHVANACRPVLASIRAKKFLWKNDEPFEFELFMLNDSYNELKNANVKVRLIYDGEQEITLANWGFEGAEAFKNSNAGNFSAKLPPMKENLFSVHVDVEGYPEYNSVYTFLVK